MYSRSAARGFLAFLLSLPALQGKIGWAVTYTSSNISALRGSTVNISCIYKYPYGRYFRPTNVTTLWFTKGEIELPVNLKHDADYAGRVEYSDGEISCNWFSCKGTCTLRIKDLTQSDSAEYKFMFITNIERGKFTGDPGVMLSVTETSPSSSSLTTSVNVRIVVVSLATVLLVFLFIRKRADREASGQGKAAEKVGEVEEEQRDRN
ncbi:unnamed protein product [Gadus morhua 'NCC']